MLDFFRRYQRYFFIVITVVIIISFSFFGTYSTLGSDVWREQIAFKAVNGHEVTRADLEEMVTFIATDSTDKNLFQGAWGPNFLNDGVLTKDFLETGLAAELVARYQKELLSDLEARSDKEKKYKLYKHPNAPFIGVDSVWGYFSPAMSTYYAQVRNAENPVSPDAFDSRVKLFLEQRKLPASTVRNILHYQERQYSWLESDPNLDHTDLALFGYHTSEDWFGSHFTHLVSQFIMNAAILAEQQGYRVTKAEALADLMRNVQISYQERQSQPNIGVASVQDYMGEQLRRLRMDQSRAVKVWTQVLLFRRYFQDAGYSALADTLAYAKYNQFAFEQLGIDLYQVPQDLRLNSYDKLQKFEIYLGAVAKPSKDKLSLPSEFLAKAEVSKSYPELVQKKFVLEIAQVNVKNISSRASLKEIWNWEAEEKNGDSLKKEFPELAIKSAQTREERIEVLDSLDTVTRNKVDVYAKNAILKGHPEWIKEALEQAPMQKTFVGLREEGGKLPFIGLDKKEDRQKLAKLLDAAPLNQSPEANSPLAAYTADQQNFYRIMVLEKAPESEILTFTEAETDGTLSAVRQRLLEKHYLAIRGKQPLLYQNDKKEWRPFESVQELVADDYFKPVIDALTPIHQSLADSAKETKMTKDRAAALRLYSYTKTAKAAIEKDPPQASKLVREASEEGKQIPLKDQWKLEKIEKEITRQGREEVVDTYEAFAQPTETWSAIKTPPNGQLAFYFVKGKSADSTKVAAATAAQTRKAQAVLSAEAQRAFMHTVLDKIQAKQAVSLDYLHKSLDPGHAAEETLIEAPDISPGG